MASARGVLSLRAADSDYLSPNALAWGVEKPLLQQQGLQQQSLCADFEAKIEGLQQQQ